MARAPARRIPLPSPAAPLLRTSMLLAVSSGCSSPDQGHHALSIAADGIQVVERIRSVPFTLEDELGIVQVADLISTPNGYALADAGGYVLLLSEDLRLLHRFGGEGGGPHELRYPLDLEPTATGGVAILDSGNNRITIIDHQGRLVETLPPPGGHLTDFAVLRDASILVGRPSEHAQLAYLFPPDGGPFGQVVDASLVTFDKALTRSLGTLLTAGPDGRVHHYANDLRVLYTYDPGGSLETIRRLPQRVIDGLDERRRELDKAFGGALVGSSPVLGLGTVGHHPLMVASSLPGIEGLGLVLDPVEPHATPILAGPDLPTDALFGIGLIVLKGDVLTGVTQDALHQFRVRYPDHLASLR